MHRIGDVGIGKGSDTGGWDVKEKGGGNEANMKGGGAGGKRKEEEGGWNLGGRDWGSTFSHARRLLAVVSCLSWLIEMEFLPHGCDM
jgi:hypothetical protein